MNAFRCFDESAGEFICPNPDVVPWLTDTLPNTGINLHLLVVVAALCFVIGVLLILGAKR